MRTFYSDMVKNWRSKHELTPQMNYPYAKLWALYLTCRSQNLKHSINLKECPIFFAWGNKKAFNFHSNRWAGELSNDEAAGGKSKCKEYKSDHWIMQENADEYTADLKKWI